MLRILNQNKHLAAIEKIDKNSNKLNIFLSKFILGYLKTENLSDSMEGITPDSESSDAALPRPSRNSLRFILGLVVSGVCLYYLVVSVEKDKVMDAFSAANPLLIGLAFIVTLFSYALRAYRWKYLFSDIDLAFFTSYRALIIGFFMNNILPARMGEIVRAHALGRKINKSRTAVLATIAAERLADGVTISMIFGVLYYFSGQNLDGARGVSYVAMLFMLASLMTVALLLIRRKIFSILEKIDRKINKAAFSFVLVRIQKFIVGLEPLFKPKLLKKVVLLSIVVWGVELFAYFLILTSFGSDVSLAVLALFLAAVNFSSLIPAAPGGIGVIETFASMALTKVGVEHELALAMVVTQHLIQYIAVGIPGAYYTFFKKKNSA